MDLFSGLPDGVLWATLNHLPFLDLVNFCSINKEESLLIQSADYFQYRSVVYGLDIKKYHLFLSSHGPKDGYVATLVDARKVDLDPTVLIYLSESKSFLVPGLEYFIGLGKMGLRAINQNDQENLLYVLRMHPNSFELDTILGTLYLKHQDFKHQGIAERFDSLPHSLFSVLLDIYRTNRGRVIQFDYHPCSDHEHESYRLGRSGVNLIQDDQISICVNVTAYVCGIIDGKHSSIFSDMIQEHPSKIVERIVAYVARHGTSDMMKSIIESSISGIDKDHWIETAIKADNLDVVEYLLPIYLKHNDDPILIPRSKKMTNLLRSKSVEVPPENVFLGAFLSGNYRLMIESPTEEINLKLIIGWSQLADLPPYLLNKCCTVYKANKFMIDGAVVSNLIYYYDLYRIGVLLSLGYVMDDRKDRIIEMLKDLPLKSVFEIDPLRYPNFC